MILYADSISSPGFNEEVEQTQNDQQTTNINHLHHYHHHHHDQRQQHSTTTSSSDPESAESRSSPDSSIISESSNVECIGICCMSFLSRLCLILSFIGNAILITFLLCITQIPSQNRTPNSLTSSPAISPIPRSSSSSTLPRSSSYDICLSYTLLAFVHFICTAGFILILINQQNHISNMPSFHSSLLFSSYILLMFTSFCIDANCLFEAVYASYQPYQQNGSGIGGSSSTATGLSSATNSPSWQTINFLPPDMDLERALFASLPIDATQAFSYAAFG
jgi:hypothetical protein